MKKLSKKDIVLLILTGICALATIGLLVFNPFRPTTVEMDGMPEYHNLSENEPAQE